MVTIGVGVGFAVVSEVVSVVVSAVLSGVVSCVAVDVSVATGAVPLHPAKASKSEQRHRITRSFFMALLLLI